ncbi:MAG: fructokinase [Paracoccaceae bacterium]|jgi:fructokinase
MRIGIDIGGTKIEGIALDSDGTTLFRERIPTPAGDYPATVAAVASLIHLIENKTNSAGSVGVGIPGAISPATGLVKNANSTCLIGKPLETDLAQAMAREIRIANDADCFALSEATDGAAAGLASVFGVILGTGVGGGIVIGGKQLSGPNAIAGEWGHNPMPGGLQRSGTEAPTCYCGRIGCIETYLSGPGLSADHKAATGHILSPPDIAAAADWGEPDADATMTRYENRLARALATVINILDPAAVVLGGGLSGIDRLYRKVPDLLPAYVFSDSVQTALLPPKHGDSSGVRGAAWLWPAQR